MNEAFEKWLCHEVASGNHMIEYKSAKQAFKAGMLRAAEIVEDTDCCKYDHPTAVYVANYIRKEAESYGL